MRMRKKSWAEPFLAEHEEVVIASPSSMKGNWRERLNKENLHLEIGCGKGDYFTHMAAMYPESGWIGVEKNINVAAIAAKKLVDSNNTNQLLIALDAEKIDEWFDHGEVDVIHLNFSDPWPKKRHHDRRLTSHIFLNKYENIFKNDKEIVQKTDNRDLFEYSVISLSTFGYKIEDISLDLHNSDYEDIITTEYEKKFVAKGNNIYYLFFELFLYLF